MKKQTKKDYYRPASGALVPLSNKELDEVIAKAKKMVQHIKSREKL